ncbi:MAG TPA: MFS transporter [Gemmataceae bacterium]|jgi:sugar phosphate permease|nr:MFS transporter [Gemmataceae bacterium]
MGQQAALPEDSISQPRVVAMQPSLVRYQVLAAACVCAFIAYIHRVGFASAVVLQDDLGLNSERWGYLMGAFLLAYGGLEIPWGLFGDRWGARHLLTLIVLASGVLTAGTFLATGLSGVALYGTAPFVVLLVIRFLFGGFQAGMFPTISRMMADWMPIQERATAQGLIWMCSRVGGAVAPFFMTFLIGVLGGWKIAFLFAGLLGLLWCIVFWPWFRNQPEEMRQVNGAEIQVIQTGRTSRPAAHGNVPWAKILRSRSVWSLCLMYGCGGFAANFFVTTLPSYLTSHRHLSPGTKDLLTSLPLACGIVGCVLGGFFSDWIIRTTGNRKWGRRLNGTIGTVTAGVAFLGINYVSQTWALALLLCLIFFCNDLGMGPAWASCADVGRRYAGTIGGAMNMVGNLAGAVGQSMAGVLFAYGYHNLVFVIFGCSFFLGTLCWQGVDVTRPVEPDE